MPPDRSLKLEARENHGKNTVKIIMGHAQTPARALTVRRLEGYSQSHDY